MGAVESHSVYIKYRMKKSIHKAQWSRHTTQLCGQRKPSGSPYRRKAREAVERTWAEIENRKYEQRSYQKEEETDHMYEKLKKAVDSIKDRYGAHTGDLTYLVDQIMQENWQVNFKGGLTV